MESPRSRSRPAAPVTNCTLRPPRGEEGAWAPDYFTAFETPKEVREKRVRLQVHNAGLGGTFVGINRPADPANSLPSVGVAGAVTAVLDFKPAAPNSKAAREVVLSLHDPTPARNRSDRGRDPSAGR